MIQLGYQLRTAWRWLIAAAVVFGVASWALYALSILAEGQQ